MELHHRPMLGAPPSPKVRPVAAGALPTAPEDDFHSQSVVPFDFEESDDEDQFRGGNDRPQADEDIFMKASRSRDEKWKWWKVYTLHFLFMFNSRTYEFASIILIAQSFPNNLTATSIRGMSSTIASLLCASAVGSSIDRSRTRLPPLLSSIFLNHAAIVLVYICWMIWPNYASDKSKQQDIPLWNIFLFAIILILDIIQDLSDLANKLSVERDLIPVLVGPVTPDMVYGLTQVNSVLKRIDFFCKLAAPSLLPLMISSFNSTVGWLLLLACGTTVMWALEVWCAFSVAKDNKEMTEPKEHTEISRYGVDSLSSSSSSTLISSSDTSISKKYSKTWSQKAYTALYLEPSLRLKHYFSTSIWQASITISFLQLTVLAYSATLITYLLEVGFLLPTITIARGTGSAMSFISTFVTPWVVQFLRKRHSRRLLNDGPGNNIKDDEDEHKIVRKVGLWGISSQFLSLVPVVIVLWNMSPKLPDGASRPPPHLLISILLFSFLSLSRFGHLTFELMLQEIEQVEIAPSQRSTFAGTEQSFESLAVLGHWAATIVWSQPEDFKLLALGSLTFVGTGAGMYAVWVRKSRPTHVETRYEEVAMEDVVSDGVERHS